VSADPAGPQEAVDEHEDNVRDLEPEEVDLDLDSLDEALRREAIGVPTTVRVDGVVIHILHAGEWPSSAMRAANTADWETWSRAVIPDDAEYQAWLDADLANYQIEAVFAECGRQARLSAGKSARLSGSRRRSRRR
jgi:hypothetical protein